MKKYLGVEIGGTKQQLCIGNGEGKILSRLSVHLNDVSAEKILDWIKNNISDILLKEKICGIGVGFGGPLETATGRILSSLQVPGWEDFELKKWFAEQFSLPVTVVNDTFAGGFGELFCGKGRGSKLLFYTNIGTGIGGGVYIGGKGFDGSGYGAAYLGNTWVPDWRGEAGSFVRMEKLCSGKSIEERLKMPAYIPKESMLAKMESSGLSCAALADAARKGDNFAKEELNRIAESFSLALSNMLAATGADRVVIGGGVAKMGEVLFSRIRYKTDKLAFIANKGRYRIFKSSLMDDAVPVGALLLAAKGESLFN